VKQTTAIVFGSLVIAAALVWSAILVAPPLREVGERLAGVQAVLESLAESASAPPARPSAAKPPPRRGPDPERQYQISLDGAPLRGAENARITIVEFSDFQCPYCGHVEQTLSRILKDYDGKVRLAFKNLPLSFHPKAMPAHMAALAAGEQGKFWEMHDKIFANQAEMAPATYERYAEELGLDMQRFKRDVDSKALQAKIDADKREAAGLGVSGTPAFFIDGYYLSGAQPYESFKAMIDRQL